ncbi:MAG: hypothetical protein V7K47_08450 [Nostoc sp.]
MNQILTLTWGITFALSALGSWLLPLNAYTVLHLALLAIAILMTVRFPSWYRDLAVKNRTPEL